LGNSYVAWSSFEFKIGCMSQQYVKNAVSFDKFDTSGMPKETR
jgi:hypothetical protein